MKLLLGLLSSPTNQIRASPLAMVSSELPPRRRLNFAAILKERRPTETDPGKYIPSRFLRWISAGTKPSRQIEGRTHCRTVCVGQTARVVDQTSDLDSFAGLATI